MKKLSALLLILLLIALCAPALAANTDGLGDTITRSAELAAFLDGNGNIYVSGLGRPVNATKANSLVSIDPYRILFFAQANASAGVPAGRLVALTLDGFSEKVVTDNAFAACLDEENVYFIARSDRTQLVRCNLDDGSMDAVFTAVEELDRIYDSDIGVIATLVDGAGAYISDPITGQFIPYVGDAAREIAEGDGYEAYLTDSANLYVRVNGALAPDLVDTNVRAWAILGRNIYYLSSSGDAMALKQYNVDANLWTFILTPPANMEPQLTASENSLFMLSADNTIYSVDVGNGRLLNFATLPSTQSYALGGTRTLTGYRIEAVSGQLNVYGEVEDSSLQPAFTFVNFNSDEPSAGDDSNILLMSAYTIDAESTVWDLLQPAAQFSPLRRGSRGDAVSAIQQPLYDKGYYHYYIDGIFGWRTERAVQLLQDALGLRVTGVADEDLQRTILQGDIPEYDPYRRLQSGDRGLRVTEMQQRLRDLGYLADDADSVFGPRTLAAVELFQRENGLTDDGVAGPETLRRLFSDSARTCSSYIDLRRGDTGYRVRELNRRLKELYYLEGDVGSTYTAATAEAVRRFQQEVGLRQTGQATVAVQRELFARNAPEYGGYITLRRGDDNDRVLEMQRRLKKLGYYDGPLDGYFGKGTYQAVRAFQREAGLKVTGVADPTTLKRLFASNAPEYQPPEELTKPVIDFYGASFDADENGVYMVPAETERLDFFWTAKGVASYDISLSGNDELITSLKGTTDEMVGVSTSRLLRDVIYTFKVVAHPVDKANNDDTSAKLRFRIVPKPTTLNEVTIHIDSSSYTYEEGVYAINRDALKFSWEADGGEVSRYEFNLTGDDGSEPANGSEVSALDATSYELSPDVIYTLTVRAYPVGNDEGVVSASILFRVVEPEALPTPVPEPEPEETSAPGEEGADDSETASPDTTDATDDESAGGEGEPSGQAEGETSEGTEGETSGESEGEPGGTEGAQGADEGSDSGEEATQPEALDVPAVEASPATGEVTMDVAAPDGSVSSEAVVTVGEGPVQLSWATEGDIAGYNVRITDEAGNVMVDQNMTDTGAPVNSAKLQPDEVYAMTATAYFNSGDTTSSTLYFMKPGEAAEEPESEAPSYEEPAEEPDEEPTDAPVEEPTDEPEEEPVDEPAEPAEEPAAEQAEPVEVVPLGVPAVQANPAIGEEVMEVAHADGSVTTESVVTVGEGSLDLAWPAEGDVAGYQVTIVDSNGGTLVDNRLTNTGASVNTQKLTPGEVYAMTVTAYANSGETSSATLYFMRPAPEVEEPTYEEPTYEEPAYEEPTYEESAYEEPTYEEPSYEEPAYEEPADEEPAYEEPTYEEPESYEDEPAEEPAEEPVEEPQVEEPAPEQAASGETTWDEPIDEDSASEKIAKIQKRLNKWGWLADESYEKGTLDEATVQAIADFQAYCIEDGSELIELDPELPEIGVDTLKLLFNEDGKKIKKPQ